MDQKIFVNLPVGDLQKSIDFFTGLGYRFNPQFTDETATCMIISETIFVMLLTREKFQSFTPYPVSDATKTTEVMICLSFESREAVDEMMKKALSLGGKSYKEPEDHGFMYGHGFQDPDGHIWELIWMNPEYVQ